MKTPSRHTQGTEEEGSCMSSTEHPQAKTTLTRGPSPSPAKHRPEQTPHMSHLPGTSLTPSGHLPICHQPCAHRPHFALCKTSRSLGIRICSAPSIHPSCASQATLCHPTLTASQIGGAPTHTHKHACGSFPPHSFLFCMKNLA